MHSLRKASDRLPVEVWEHILDDAMDNTLLLTSSPSDYPWEFTRALQDWICPMYEIDDTKHVYWGIKDSPAMRQFRRVRAQIRLVCRFWKHYADSHKVGTLCGRLCVPAYPSDDSSIRDVTCAKRLEVVNPHYDPFSILDGVLQQALQERKRFMAEVLIDVGGTITNGILRKHHDLFPRLTALHINLRRCKEAAIITLDLDEILPQLIHLTCLSLHIGWRHPIPDKVFQLYQLVTLSIIGESELSLLHPKWWRLPSLSHLELVGVDRNVIFGWTMTPLFQLSRRLRTLFIKPWCIGPYHRAHISTSSLSFGPHKVIKLAAPISTILTIICSTLSGLFQFVNTDPWPIAQDFVECHPLHGFMAWYGKISKFFRQAPRLRIITDVHDWHDTITKANTPMETQLRDAKTGLIKTVDIPEYELKRLKVAEITMLLARKLDTLGIRYEDKHNLTLKEISRQYA